MSSGAISAICRSRYGRHAVGLGGLRRAVVGRPALQHVGDVDVARRAPVPAPRACCRAAARPGRRRARRCASSSAPGASPTNSHSAFGSPTPGTTAGASAAKPARGAGVDVGREIAPLERRDARVARCRRTATRAAATRAQRHRRSPRRSARASCQTGASASSARIVVARDATSAPDSESRHRVASRGHRRPARRMTSASSRDRAVGGPG